MDTYKDYDEEMTIPSAPTPHNNPRINLPIYTHSRNFNALGTLKKWDKQVRGKNKMPF